MALGLHPSVPTKDAEAAALKDHISVSWARLFGAFPSDAQIAMVTDHLRNAPVDAEAAIKYLAGEARAEVDRVKAAAERAAQELAAKQTLTQQRAEFAAQVADAHTELGGATFPSTTGGND